VSSYIRDQIDSIMARVATITGDPNRATSPFYAYGDKTFDTHEGSPPQVRWRKRDFVLGDGEQNTSTSGSIATFEQDVQCSVWGNDESQAIDEFNYLMMAIRSVTGSQLSQAPIVDIRGEWADTSPKATRGEMLTFDYAVRLNIPERLVGTTLILSASGYITGSASLSGSMSGTLDPVKDIFIP
jgi:hypothetical protein